MAIKQQTPPNADRPFLESDLTLSEQSREWANAVTLSVPIIGTGSPEGVVDAPQRQLYMDDAGVTAAILYIKKLDFIESPPGVKDSTKGWILI